MPRIARVVLPGYPHHITQRGNRRQNVFFCDEDYHYYLMLLKTYCMEEGVEVWSYCLMTNHVHLIIVPHEHSSLAKAIGETHRRYTRRINFRKGWRGYLWQGRFSSFPMDGAWLLKAAAYVELNPVKAGIVKQPWDYPWSSVHAHLSGSDSSGIIEAEKLCGLIPDWRDYLLRVLNKNEKVIEEHERTGRPLGNDLFIEKAEKILGRNLKKKKPGPKTKTDN